MGCEYCLFCGKPLKEPNESLEEFRERLRELSSIEYGVNVLPRSCFCSLRCMDDYYGYDFD